jgi:hypothetical protein
MFFTVIIVIDVGPAAYAIRRWALGVLPRTAFCPSFQRELHLIKTFT